MTRLPIFILLMASACCFAQQPCTGGAPPKNAPDCIPASQYIKQIAQPAPLECDNRYEYRTFVSTKEQPEFHEGCLPLMHTVTEKEWQEREKRLKDLEEAVHFLLRPAAK